MILIGPRVSAADSPGEGALVEVAVRAGEDGFDAVAADPGLPRRLWAASGGRVLVSEDGGRSWRELVRLPGAGAVARNGTADGHAERGAVPEIEEGLEEDEGDPGDPDLGAPSAASRAVSASDEARTEAGEGRRIRGLRAAGDELWIAAADGAYRWSPEPGGGRLARFAVPGEAAVVAIAPEPRDRATVAPGIPVPKTAGSEPPPSGAGAPLREPGVDPDPGGPARVWLATTSGLWTIDGARLSRVPGAAGVTPVRDVDVRRVGGTTRVAVASDAGLFLSSDGGYSFEGPLPVGGPGISIAAVRLLADGSGLAMTREGVLARFDGRGPGEARPIPGMGRGVTRLHVAGEPGEETDARALPSARRERTGSGDGPDAVASEPGENADARAHPPARRERTESGDGPDAVARGRERRLWIGTEAGLFLVPWDATADGSIGGSWPGAAVPVTRGLAAARVRDVVTPAGEPDRPLVATDRGLFLRVGPDRLPPWRTAPGFAAMSVARLGAAAEAHLGLPVLAPRASALAPLLPRLDASWTLRPAELGRRDTWAVIARWDLGRLFGVREDLGVSAVERRLARARRSLLVRIERAVRARNRLLASADARGDALAAALARLDVEEQTARLDGWTGGRFSASRGAAAGEAGARP